MNADWLPAEFLERIRGTFGPKGDAWLEALPELLLELSGMWSLTLEPPFADLSYSYVAPATHENGARFVLKVGVPNPELITEIEALRAFDGAGCVRLIDAAPERGALLLERLVPGEALRKIDDVQATEIACEVMGNIWREEFPHGNFPTTWKWGQGFRRLRARFQGGTGPFPEELIDRGERRFHELLDGMGPPVLLHGDLHHSNILSAKREPWLAIDPKGVVGEPAYEVGSWLRNPYPEILQWEDFTATLQRRLTQFSACLRFPRERLLGWAFSQAVLSACWMYEDNQKDWERGLVLAEWFQDADSANR